MIQAFYGVANHFFQAVNIFFSTRYENAVTHLQAEVLFCEKFHTGTRYASHIHTIKRAEV